MTTSPSHRTINPTPFLTKTYQLVDDPSSDDMISWNENGNAFVVWRPAEFARDLLPKYFKHNNFSSFIRQLNTYGFRKIVSDRWEFSNDYFRRGQKSLLGEIHRRKIISITTTTSSSSGGGGGSSSSSSALYGQSSRTLFEENERLKEQNSNLRCEVDHLRTLCCNVVTMMSNFIVIRQPAEEMMDNIAARDQKLLLTCDPIPAGPVEDKNKIMCPRTRLFGVSIGSKHHPDPDDDDVRTCCNL